MDSQKNQRSPTDPKVAAVIWDVENCRIPCDVLPGDVPCNIRKVLEGYNVKKFAVYGDLYSIPRELKETLHRSAVELIHVPSGKKDAADKAIIAAVFTFALDNPSPALIMLISGDVDFSQTLNIVHQRGYTVVLVVPAGVNVSSTLIKASDFFYEWPSVVHGEVLPISNALLHPFRAYTTGHSRNYLNGQNGKGSTSNTGAFPPLKTCFDHQTMNNLKKELVKLVDLSGGNLPLSSLPGYYKKYCNRPVFESMDGGMKLLELLGKMGDELAIVDKGTVKFVSLRKSVAGTSHGGGKSVEGSTEGKRKCGSLSVASKYKKGKGILEEN